MRRALAYFLIVLLCAVSPALNAASQPKSVEAPQSLETDQIMIRTQANKRHIFTVEVADEFAEQRIGLMHRRSLADDAGMIFLYDAPRTLGMWMKNTLIPLDMLFIDEAGRVINIKRNAKPHSTKSIRAERPGVAVLEIAGGRARALGLSAGDQIYHCHFGNWPCAEK